jgi:hypothetical protein
MSKTETTPTVGTPPTRASDAKAIKLGYMYARGIGRIIQCVPWHEWNRDRDCSVAWSKAPSWYPAMDYGDTKETTLPDGTRRIICMGYFSVSTASGRSVVTKNDDGTAVISPWPACEIFACHGQLDVDGYILTNEERAWGRHRGVRIERDGRVTPLDDSGLICVGVSRHRHESST